MVQGGILQFQLCIDLSQLCSLKLYRTRHDYKQKIKANLENGDPNTEDSPLLRSQQKSDTTPPTTTSSGKGGSLKDFTKTEPPAELALDSSQDDEEDVFVSAEREPTIYPCIEFVVPHGRRYHCSMMDLRNTYYVWQNADDLLGIHSAQSNRGIVHQNEEVGPGEQANCKGARRGSSYLRVLVVCAACS